MNLKKYDNKLIQIKSNDGKVYEGVAIYNNREYSYHEFGRDEECLDVFSILFYKNDMDKITIIDKYTDLYGEIEKDTIKDGIDFVEQSLESEDDDRIYRLLLCLLDNNIDYDLTNSLKYLIKYNKNEKIINKAKELLSRLKRI